ncbi:hypothetical protein [Vulcanisaeta sp. JCM 16159]|uniref:hypothetical protein n=1 Tax=Vulcanisaeta sp. JCM 16159 TaxID=1295371 RepID=UPI000AF980BE|nr:hypothetical protein [Vulcanisaeta sp. JCM 16159]
MRTSSTIKLLIGLFPRWLMVRYKASRYLRDAEVVKPRKPTTGGFIPRLINPN